MEDLIITRFCLGCSLQMSVNVVCHEVGKWLMRQTVCPRCGRTDMRPSVELHLKVPPTSPGIV